MTELQLQALCFQWAYNQHPQTRRCFFHIPNGGYRNKREAMELKASGVIAGVYDMLFLWQGRVYFFELKVGVNQQSSAQKQFGESVKAQGAQCYEIRDFETFKHIFLGIIHQKQEH